MAPKLKKKKQRKPENLADHYTAVLAQKSRYTGNYEVLQHTSTMKRLPNIVWAVKTRSCYFNGSVCRSVECCCRLSDSQMAAVARGYFATCLYKLFVGCIFGSVSIQTAGRTVAGASAMTPFSAENNVPGVSSVG